MKYKIFFLALIVLIPLKLQASQDSKQIKVFDYSGNLISAVILQDYDWYKTGDIKVADLGNDNVPEIILSAPAGEKPYLKIYRLDGTLINQFLVYPESYLGGINFEVVDYNDDGINEIITAATYGGGPHVLILNNQGKILKSFFAFDQTDRGGINVAVGNLYNDLNPEIIVSSNSNNKIRIFDLEGNFLNELILENNFQYGQKIATFDLGIDGINEIFSFANQNDGPYLNLYQNNGELMSSYLVFNQDFKGGFSFDQSDYKLFIGAGFGAGPHLKIVDGYTNTISQFFTEDEDFLGGLMLSVYNNLIYTIPEQFPTAEYEETEYISIDISDQKLRYYKNGFLKGDYAISSGTAYYPTPLGEFSILNKTDLAYSNTYGLYMPYWMNFYGGFGIHELPYWPGGYREGEDHLGTRVSHGCVRLGIGPAQELYNNVEVGTKVYIQD